MKRVLLSSELNRRTVAIVKMEAIIVSSTARNVVAICLCLNGERLCDKEQVSCAVKRNLIVLSEP